MTGKAGLMQTDVDDKPAAANSAECAAPAAELSGSDPDVFEQSDEAAVAAPAGESLDGTDDHACLENWYAVAVKSRHEFVAACELMKKGITSFLPTVTSVRQWQDRKKHLEQPLFPGYLFVRIPRHAELFIKVLQTRGVACFVSLEPGHPTAIANEEVESLRLLVDSGIAINLYPEFLQGCRVRVKNGPLKTAEGTLFRKDDGYLFQVNIELLGRSVSVAISPQDIETV